MSLAMASPASSSSSKTNYSYKGFLALLTAFLLTLVIIYISYRSLTSSSKTFYFGDILLSISPYTWALMGIASAFGFSVIGAAM